MSTSGDGGDLALRARQAVDALVYGLAVTAVTSLVGGVVSLAAGLGWAGLELVLFLVGTAGLGYASFVLRGPSRWDVEVEDDGLEVTRPSRSRVVGSREETRFQAAVQRLPPLRRHGLPPEDRLSSPAKLFVASLCLLVTSIIVEVVFVW